MVKLAKNPSLEIHMLEKMTHKLGNCRKFLTDYLLTNELVNEGRDPENNNLQLKLTCKTWQGQSFEITSPRRL